MVNKKNSLKRKLLVFSSLLICFCIIIIVVFNMYRTKDLIFEKNISNMEKTTEAIDLNIEKYLLLAYDKAKTIQLTIDNIMASDDDIDRREFIEEYIEKIIIEGKGVVGIGVGFIPNGFDNRDNEYVGNKKYGDKGQFIPYISYINEKLEIVPLIDMEIFEWYLKPKEQEQATISEPYYYKVQDNEVLMTTISIPIFYDNKFVGVVGVDITLDFIYFHLLEEIEKNNIEANVLIVSEKGYIVADNYEETQVLTRIEDKHPDYQNDIEYMNENEGLYDNENNGFYEINRKITIGRITSNWYLFSEVSNKVIMYEMNEIGRLNLIIAIILILLFLGLFTFLIYKSLNPLLRFSKQMEAFNINDIDNTAITIDENTDFEVRVLINAYIAIIEKIKEDFFIKSKKDNLLNSQMEISNSIQTCETLKELSNEIITTVTKQVNGHVGVLYINTSNNYNKEDCFELTSTYAYKKGKGLKTTFKNGEGLIGQVAKDRKIMIINDIPKGYLINSGIGEINLSNIIIVPCIYNKKVIAIIEIGLINVIDEYSYEYIDSIKINIAVAINNVVNNDKTKLLLSQTIELSKQLKEQEEELRVSNEELEEQQEELKTINSELELNIDQLDKQQELLENKNSEISLAKVEVEKKAIALELANKYKSEFLANMSHELRTPLNSILVLSEILSDNKNKTLLEKEVEFSKTINTSGKDLLNLINDILDLSKVESGKEEVEISKMSMESFSKEMKNLFEPISIKSKVEFTINILKKVPSFIMTDSQKLKQIVKNLLSNAFKFTKNGSVNLKIYIKENELYFKIIDTGVGIDKKKKESIFEAFNQEDGTTSRKFGGTGLGLSISKEYSKLLGGRISVESTKGKGSTFSFILPIEFDNNSKNNENILKEKVIEIPKQSEYLLDDRHDINETDKVILIVDDDYNFVKVLYELVKAKKYKVIVAETGEIALYLADYYLPTGIILDIGLPGIDGYEVVKRLNSNKRTSDIPVHIVSGREKDITKDLNKKVKFYNKPIGKNQLISILEETSLLTQKIKNILVIEENLVLRDDMIKLISKNYKNINICSSGSGNEALEELEKTKIGLIILNFDLEDVKQFDFIKVLNENTKYSDIPIIIYTEQNITKTDEIELRKKVSDIIIKGEKSTRRLIDEIKIFVNKVKDTKLIDDTEIFDNKTILAVDDDMRNIFALSSILESKGIKVEIATNGKEALEQLKVNNKINLVLMDIMMPEMDGYEAMKIIRKTDNISEIPIIALTAKAMKGDREKCIKAGANEYLAKPIDKDKLLSMLRVWL